jgi:hypothetical protein
MKLKTSDYTQAEITRFQKMHEVLTAYNVSLGAKNELPLPEYRDDEMAAYSIYRELLIAETAARDERRQV